MRCRIARPDERAAPDGPPGKVARVLPAHARGWRLPAGVLALLWAPALFAAPAPARFDASPHPRVDRGYHDGRETDRALTTLARRFPDLVAPFDIGRSAHGRPLRAVKLSDAVGLDEAEPEVLLVAGQHAREHLSVEAALYLARELAEGYGRDARVRRLLDTREVWIVVDLNPDGRAWDRAGPRYRKWRKNRRSAGRRGRAVGVDLNRNWGWRWGYCCEGSSGDPAKENYRGPRPFSEPETRRLRDFVASRVVGGVQQIRAAVDLHTHSELVLWPFGYTPFAVTPQLGRRDAAAFAALGRQVAAATGFDPMRQWDLYPADGTLTDWLWATHRIYALTMELYPPPHDAQEFYPPASAIDRETARIRAAILDLVDLADCVPRVAGAARRRCGVASVSVYAEDFERPSGWTRDPLGTDTATAGRWRRGRPGPTRADVRRRAWRARGTRALVTGSLRDDVDGGTASALSPPVTLGVGVRQWLRFGSRLVHDGPTSRRDLLRVSALTSGGTRVVLHERRPPREADPSGWVRTTVALDDLAGQTVRFLVEAVDAGRDGYLEAAVDRVRVTREEPPAGTIAHVADDWLVGERLPPGE